MNKQMENAKNKNEFEKLKLRQINNGTKDKKIRNIFVDWQGLNQNVECSNNSIMGHMHKNWLKGAITPE